MTLSASLKIVTAVGAFIVAGGLVSASHPAFAADLYNDDVPSRSSAYDDPRYADLYGRAPPPPVETYRSESYREYQAYPPLPRARVYRDDYDGDRYASRSRGGCASKDEISSRLESNGWRGFHNPQIIDRERATVDARRPNGRAFRLEVDRCNGNVLAERPLDGPRYGYRGEDFGSYAESDRRSPRSY